MLTSCEPPTGLLQRLCTAPSPSCSIPSHCRQPSHRHCRSASPAGWGAGHRFPLSRVNKNPMRSGQLRRGEGGRVQGNEGWGAGVMGPLTLPGTWGLVARHDKPSAGSEVVRTARLPAQGGSAGWQPILSRNTELVPAACAAQGGHPPSGNPNPRQHCRGCDAPGQTGLCPHTHSLGGTWALVGWEGMAMSS